MAVLPIQNLFNSKKNKLVLTTNVPVDDQFSSPRQIRWSAALGKLLVTAISSNDINHLRNADLSFYSKFYIQFFGSGGIDADSTNVYIAQRPGGVSDKVVKLSSSTFQQIAISGIINNPRMIDASGDSEYIYVTSNNATDGHGVRKIRKSDMTVVASILSTGAGDGQFNNPLGIKYYDGYVYICDFSNVRIVKLNASDLSFVANYATSWACGDLSTDGTNWYVTFSTKLGKFDMNFTDATKVTTNTDCYSLCIIPDQGDGYGATLAIVDSTNSHLERRKCSDLSLINSVGSAGDGAGSIYDPTFITAVDTDIVWTTDDGQSGVMSKTGSAPSITHAHSKNGFAGIFFASPGPHRVTYSVRGGLGLIKSIDCNTDAISNIKNLGKCKNLAAIVSYYNTYELLISEIPNATNICALEPVRGLISEINRSATIVQIYIGSASPNLFGSISDFPSTCQTIWIRGNTHITAGSVAHILGIANFRSSSMGWLTADVDLVLKSISDAIHVDAGHFTYATPVLNIGGTNQAPSHLDGWIDPLITPGAGNSDAHWEWDAGAGKHKAISGGAAIWAANHCAGHPWAITFNGGVSEDSLLGNVIGTGEKTWADSVFGNTTQYYQKFTAVAGTIGDIRIKCATSCNVKVAIYDDDGAAGDPGTLLAYSTSTACVSGWNTVQLNIQVPLTAGSYWLSFKSDTGNFSYRITTGGVSQYSGSIAYADAFPNPAPDLIDRTNDYAIAGWGLKVV